jgi:hypothetical protein
VLANYLIDHGLLRINAEGFREEVHLRSETMDYPQRPNTPDVIEKSGTKVYSNL